MSNKTDIVIFTDSASRSMAFARYAGAYTIATVLRNNGYTVQVIDYFLLTGLDTTLKLLDKFVGPNTLMVGFSTTFMNINDRHIQESLKNSSMFRFSDICNSNAGTGINGSAKGIPISSDEMDIIRNRIKNINPNTKLVMGGTKADHIEQKQMDAFVLGYADNSIIAYLNFIQGKNPFFQYRIINNNQIIVDYDVDAVEYNFVQSKIEYHETDKIRPGEVLASELSRGCVFKCKFCAFRLIGKKKNDYIKEKETIYSEFMNNYEKFRTTKYILADDTFNESVGKLADFAEVTARLPFKIEYATYLRHDLIHRFPEMADLLKESGIKSATFGIETLNHTTGKIIGKGLHPDLTKETLMWLREDKGWKNNITMNSGFIAGLPSEDRDTINIWAEELLDFKYPLDSFRIHPLFINPNATRTSKSEFEKNYADYGYYFDSNKSTGWINEHWRYEDATALAATIQSYAEAIGRIKAHGFRPIMLRNYGFEWDDIHNMSSIEYGNKEFYATIEMAKEYHTRLLQE